MAGEHVCNYLQYWTNTDKKTFTTCAHMQSLQTFDARWDMDWKRLTEAPWIQSRLVCGLKNKHTKTSATRGWATAPLWEHCHWNRCCLEHETRERYAKWYQIPVCWQPFCQISHRFRSQFYSSWLYCWTWICIHVFVKTTLLLKQPLSDMLGIEKFSNFIAMKMFIVGPGWLLCSEAIFALTYYMLVLTFDAYSHQLFVLFPVTVIYRISNALCFLTSYHLLISVSSVDFRFKVWVGQPSKGRWWVIMWQFKVEGRLLQLWSL